MKKLALCIGLLMYSRQVAKASTITFDDGTVGGTIGTFYTSLGITFSNASWAFPPPGFQIGGSTGLLLEDLTDNGFNPPYSPTSTTPIVGIFSSPQDFVSILGVDVGTAGMELDAYDAGGNLLASPQFFGTRSRSWDVPDPLCFGSRNFAVRSLSAHPESLRWSGVRQPKLHR